MTQTNLMNWGSKSRQHVREIAEKKNYVKVGLYFPSHSCNDLDRALDLKMIDKKTFLIIVEGDRDLDARKKNLISIRKFLKKHELTNVHIHRSRVHTLKLNKVLNGLKIDLMFFDICGNYSPEIANWLNKYQDCFAYNMRLPMTIAIHPRGKKRAGTSELFKAMEKVSDSTLKDLKLNNIPNDILGSEDIECVNLIPDIRNTIKAIHHTFSRRVVRFKHIRPYRFSTTNMVNFETILGREKDEEDTFEAIAQTYSKKVCNALKLRKERKIKKKYTKKTVTFKTAYDIARYMGIFGEVKSVAELPQGRQSHITINANKVGLDPVKVRAQIEKRLEKYGLNA